MELIGILFIALKLCGVITWPWIWVLIPFWIGLAIYLVIFVLVGGIAVLAGMVTSLIKRN